MKQLSLLPLARLNAALVSLGLETHAGKPAAIEALVGAINAGRITFDQISAAPLSAAPAVAVADPALGVRITELERSIADSRIKLQGDVERVQSELIAEQIKIRDRIVGALESKEAQLADLSKAILTKIESVQDVDYAVITKAIRAEVAALVEPFKAEPTTAILERIAAAVPATRASTAGEAFAGQATTYTVDGETVDFDSLPVTLWDDPQTPSLLEDYVFQPQWLHQALISVEQKLPFNIWLAGERGTGKTEFVTQLAARLGRRLFRLNFDEASERADFVGGNTIKDGTVVWQDGVLSQAIRHSGALILLDEIGFARPQSIAVLHAVCEPSVHRSLTVQETGQRIPVAPYVCFFTADNSNGYGDSSGNFAGLRDQSTAFIDRFTYTFFFEYLNEKDEAKLISERAGFPIKAATVIVKVANLARNKAKAGMLTQPPSLRQLIGWASAVKAGIPVLQAYRTSVINKYPVDCEAELLGVFTAGVNVAEFKRLLKGE